MLPPSLGRLATLLAAAVAASAVLGRGAARASPSATPIEFDFPSECVDDCIVSNGCGADSPKCLCAAAGLSPFLVQVVQCLFKHCGVCSADAAEEAFLDVVQQGCAAAGMPVPQRQLGAAETAASSLAAHLPPVTVTTTSTSTRKKSSSSSSSPSRTSSATQAKTTTSSTGGDSSSSSTTESAASSSPPTAASTPPSETPSSTAPSQPPPPPPGTTSTTPPTPTTALEHTSTSEAPAHDTTDASPFTNPVSAASSLSLSLLSGSLLSWLAAAAAAPLVAATAGWLV